MLRQEEMSAIVNHSLFTVVFPSFKTATVKPLLKKSNIDHLIPKNYRPISNLTFLCKSLEKLVFKTA